MLNRLHIQNYKCLLDVTVDLGELTVLIGPNDSGKSSFLEVIRGLGRIAKESYGDIFTGDRGLSNLVWRKEAERNVVWGVEGLVGAATFSYEVALPADHRPTAECFIFQGKKVVWTEDSEVKVGPQGQVRGHAQPGFLWFPNMVKQPPYSAVAEALTSTIEYHFDPEKLAAPAIPEPGAVLRPSGENLAGVLDTLQNQGDRSSFEAVEKVLHTAIPSVKGIALPAVRNPPGAKALEFILSGDGRSTITIPASLASTGALLLTAFLTLAYTQTPEIVLVEEPENGLHPSRLGWVIDLLRKISAGEIGNRKRQVVITTHNPLLLNYATPEEIRVFVRNAERGTQVTPMTKVPDIHRLMDEFAVGELWYLLGEDKLFEGQPA
jgi:predicted ATPase